MVSKTGPCHSIRIRNPKEPWHSRWYHIFHYKMYLEDPIFVINQHKTVCRIGVVFPTSAVVILDMCLI